MLVAVCADKGAPGVTTASLALAAVWHHPVVLVELDPAGGDVAVLTAKQTGGVLAASPSVLGLAAASRSRGDDPGLVGEFSQTLSGGIGVVPGLTVAEQSGGMAALWPTLTQACVASAVDVIADLGRVNSASPVMGVAAAADVVVVVVTPTLAGVLRLRERMNRLRETFMHTSERPPVVVPLVVTRERDASTDVGQINQVVGAGGRQVQPSWYLAEDPDGVARLLAGEPVTGRLGRTALIRSARVVVDQLISLTSRAGAVI